MATWWHATWLYHATWIYQACTAYYGLPRALYSDHGMCQCSSDGEAIPTRCMGDRMAHARDVNPRSAACANPYLGLPCFDRTIADLFAEAGAARERWVEQAQRPDFRRCLAVLLLP